MAASPPARGIGRGFQHTLACLNERGRAAVVLDNRRGDTRLELEERGQGTQHPQMVCRPRPDRRRHPATGQPFLQRHRRPASLWCCRNANRLGRKNKIVLLNASKHVRKGQPKNFIPDEDIRPLAAAYLKGEPVEGEVAVITREQAEEADYNLSPSRWVGANEELSLGSNPYLIKELRRLNNQDVDLTKDVLRMLAPLAEEEKDG